MNTTREVWPTKEKKQSTKPIPEEDQMLNLLAKDIKSAIINIF